MCLLAGLAVHMAELHLENQKNALIFKLKKKFLISVLENHFSCFIPHLNSPFYLQFATKNL